MTSEQEPIVHRCSTCGSVYDALEFVDLKVPQKLPDCCVGKLAPLVLATEKRLVVLAALLQQQLLIRSKDEQQVHLDRLADIAVASNNPGLRKAAMRYRQRRFKP